MSNIEELIKLRDKWAEELAKCKYNDDKEIFENCIEELEQAIETIKKSRRRENGKDY